MADSMAYWGKLIAWKLGIPFVSSTTTFAFNRYSTRVMKGKGGNLFSVLLAMPKINKSLKRLRAKGYEVKNVLSIIENDNETNTIVYTAPEFQPYVETFSEKYHFVGASIRPVKEKMEKADVPTVYISMGTVLNQREDFYKNCIAALKNSAYRVILSVGASTDLASFGEALYFGVPMVLVPQTPEQFGVANRTSEIGAGFLLADDNGQKVGEAVADVIERICE